MATQKKRGYRNKIYSNLKAHLDDKLVARGWFDTHASGETDWDGNTLSRLYPVQNDPNYPIDTGSLVHLWQGHRRNWVSESGVQIWASGQGSPTIARSGYVGGVASGSRAFDGTSGLAIDFRNGRVIFENPIAFDSVVDVEYSYKEVWVDTISRDMITTQVTSIDNTKRIIINNVPSGEIGQLPMILMEIGKNPAPQGRQLGGGYIFNPTVFCHVVAENRYDKDELIDFLQYRTHETFTMVDWDLAPAQFTYEGDFASTWDTLPNLIAAYPGSKMWVKGAELVENDDIAEDGYYTALVRMDLEIHTNEVF
jgi:hypothetical protein